MHMPDLPNSNHHKPVGTIKSIPHPTCQFLFARSETCLLIQIVGRALMSNCTVFGDMMVYELKDGVKTVIVDFSQCEGVDSTAIGMIVRLSNAAKEGQQIMLANITTKVAGPLKHLGVVKMFPILKNFVIPPDCKTITLPIPKDHSTEEMLKVVVESHKALAQLNSKNQELFGHFLQMIESESSNKK